MNKRYLYLAWTPAKAIYISGWIQHQKSLVKILTRFLGTCDWSMNSFFSTHIYRIPIGFGLIRPKSYNKSRTHHYNNKKWRIIKMLWWPKFRHHSQTNGQTPTAPPRGDAQLQPIYIPYWFQLDPTKTLGQDMTLNLVCKWARSHNGDNFKYVPNHLSPGHVIAKTTWLTKMLWWPKFDTIHKRRDRRRPQG